MIHLIYCTFMTSTSEILSNHKDRNIKILLIRITCFRLIDRAVFRGHTRSTAASRDACRFSPRVIYHTASFFGDMPRRPNFINPYLPYVDLVSILYTDNNQNKFRTGYLPPRYSPASAILPRKVGDIFDRK